MKNDPMVKWQSYFPAALLDEVDAWGRANGLVKRSDAMRVLLRQALDAAKPPRLPGMDEAMARMNVTSETEVWAKLLEDFLTPDLAPPPAPATEPKPKPGIIERGVKALKSIASDQPMSPAQRAAAKRT